MVVGQLNPRATSLKEAATVSAPAPTLLRRMLRRAPAAFAVLAAVLGLLVLATVFMSPGDEHGHEHGYQSAGLRLTVGQMVWMSNDMTGQGPLKVPPGFPMDQSMMPGMQAADVNRLRVVLDLANAGKTAQHYSDGEFAVVAPGGGRWTPSDDGGGSAPAAGAVLQPGFDATVDVYFDIPVGKTQNLSVQWSRGGHVTDFPVTTSGVPAPHHH